MTHIKKKLQPLQHISWDMETTHYPYIPCVVCCYKSFKIRKKERKEGSENREEKKIFDLICEQYTNACKLVQIEMGKTLKTMQINNYLLIIKCEGDPYLLFKLKPLHKMKVSSFFPFLCG